MDEINQEHINELGYIYHQRNVLGKERDSIRHKHRYLQDVKRALKARKDPMSLWQTFMKGPTATADEWNNFLSQYRLDNPLPKKFKDISLSEMNMLLLESEAKLATIKLKIMKHTKKYDKRVKFLSEKLSTRIQYSCGIVIGIYLGEQSNGSLSNKRLSQSDLKRHHDEYLANKAIEKMLKE